MPHFDAAFTRYVDVEVEHAAHVAQRHADRASPSIRACAPRLRSHRRPSWRTPGGPRGRAGHWIGIDITDAQARERVVLGQGGDSPTAIRAASPETIGIAPGEDRLLVNEALGSRSARTPGNVGVIDVKRSRAPWPASSRLGRRTQR